MITLGKFVTFIVKLVYLFIKSSNLKEPHPHKRNWILKPVLTAKITSYQRPVNKSKMAFVQNSTIDCKMT